MQPRYFLFTSVLISCSCPCLVLQHWDDSDIPDLLSWMEDHLQVGGKCWVELGCAGVERVAHSKHSASVPRGATPLRTSGCPAPPLLLCSLPNEVSFAVPPRLHVAVPTAACACFPLSCLQEGIATLSSFERYKKELLGGQLTWAPMHESGE